MVRASSRSPGSVSQARRSPEPSSCSRPGRGPWRLRGPGRDRSRLHRSHVLVRPNGKQAGGEDMNWNLKGGEMNLLPYGYIAWLLCVAGAVIASLPQWFIVQAPHGEGSAITAEIIGLPILFVGSILLIISWLPERRRKYPEVLEKTMTPVPEYYLNQPEEGS